MSTDMTQNESFLDTAPSPTNRRRPNSMAETQLFVILASVHIVPMASGDIREMQVIPARDANCTNSALNRLVNPLKSHGAPYIIMDATFLSPAPKVWTIS
jgi:hypothetical protein